MELNEFLAESNKIEGINVVTDDEVEAALVFLGLDHPMVGDLVSFAMVMQSDIRLRTQQGQDVMVGNHMPPRGGPKIRKKLEKLLDQLPSMSPFWFHVRYETLHPFTDGNGRTGRILWLWRLVRDTGGIPPLGFLHTFYYQTLRHVRFRDTQAP
jgi:hypothetical protein